MPVAKVLVIVPFPMSAENRLAREAQSFRLKRRERVAWFVAVASHRNSRCSALT